MQAKSIELVWIVVKDLKQAVKFYTETVGLKLVEEHEQFGWAELQGHEGGARLGLAQEQDKDDLPSGQNAFFTFTVDNLEKTKEEMLKKGTQCLGEIQEVPGHVKLQMATDKDGNRFQIVQKLHG